MRNNDTPALATRERETEINDETSATRTTSTIGAVNMDDFFSDAPLDVESAVTGKTCNIFDPDCEACQ